MLFALGYLSGIDDAAYAYGDTTSGQQSRENGRIQLPPGFYDNARLPKQPGHFSEIGGLKSGGPYHDHRVSYEFGEWKPRFLTPERSKHKNQQLERQREKEKLDGDYFSFVIIKEIICLVI